MRPIRRKHHDSLEEAVEPRPTLEVLDDGETARASVGKTHSLIFWAISPTAIDGQLNCRIQALLDRRQALAPPCRMSSH